MIKQETVGYAGCFLFAQKTCTNSAESDIMKVRGREIPQVRRVAYEVAMQGHSKMLLQESVCGDLWTWIGFGVLLPDSAHPVHCGADYRGIGYRRGQTYEIVLMGGITMKIVLIDHPKVLGFLLRHYYKIPKLKETK